MDVGDLIFEGAVMAGMADINDGELPPSEMKYGFDKLNQFVDMEAGDRLTIFREERVGPFNVVSGQGDVTGGGTGIPTPITIGVGGTWNTPRPMYIDRAGIVYTAQGNPQPELAMHVFTTQEWARIVVKGITATLSRSMFYDRTFTDPDGFGNIYLYPVPSASFQAVLYVPVAVSEFPVDVDGNPIYTTKIYLPPGYRAMLVSNLAVIMSIGVLPVSPDLREQAVRTLASVKAENVITHMDALSCDAAVVNRSARTSGWDWITGEIN